MVVGALLSPVRGLGRLMLRGRSGSATQKEEGCVRAAGGRCWCHRLAGASPDTQVTQWCLWGPGGVVWGYTTCARGAEVAQARCKLRENSGEFAAVAPPRRLRVWHPQQLHIE